MLKQGGSTSVLDLVLASDPMHSKSISAGQWHQINVVMHLWINWHILTRNKQWDDHSRQRNNTKFDPKDVAFLQIFWSLRGCGKGPDIPVEVNSKHAQQD